MKRLNVLMETQLDNPIKVGRLVQQQRVIHFEYDAEWLTKGFSLSPYHLPLSAGLINDTTQLWQGFTWGFQRFSSRWVGAIIDGSTINKIRYRPKAN